MFVIDCSAIVAALTVPRQRGILSSRLGAATELHAPQVLDVEFLHALRRLVATGQLHAERAQRAREDFAAMRVRRHPHEPLADRAWELRNTVTPSDALYIALAEALQLPYITCDPHLPGAGALAANVELVEP